MAQARRFRGFNFKFYFPYTLFFFLWSAIPSAPQTQVIGPPSRSIELIDRQLHCWNCSNSAIRRFKLRRGGEVKLAELGERVTLFGCHETAVTSRRRRTTQKEFTQRENRLNRRFTAGLRCVGCLLYSTSTRWIDDYRVRE